MIDEKKKKELTDQVTRKEKEVSALTKKKQNAIAEPLEYAKYAGMLRNAQAELDGLRRTLQAAAVVPEALTAVQVLLRPFDEMDQKRAVYIDEVQVKIDEARKQRAALQMEIAEAEKNLDAEKGTKASQTLADVENSIRFLEKAKAGRQAEPSYDIEKVYAAWDKICEEQVPLLQGDLKQLALLKQAYISEMNILMNRWNSLKEARLSVETRVNRSGQYLKLQPTIYKFLNVDDARIDKTTSFPLTHLQPSVSKGTADLV